MIGKRKFAAMIAIVVAVILVIPTSYVLLVDRNPPLPAISASNTAKNVSWSANFPNVSNASGALLFFNGFSTFNQPGYANSSLVVAAKTAGYFFTEGKYFAYAFFLTVSGTMYLGHFPSGVYISNSLPQSHDPSVQGAYVVDNGTAPLDNVTPAVWGSYSGAAPLVRESSNSMSNPYHFSFVELSAFFVYNLIHDVPFTISVNVSLTDLSRPVYTHFTLNITNTGPSETVWTQVRQSPSISHPSSVQGPVASRPLRPNPYPARLPLRLHPMALCIMFR